MYDDLLNEQHEDKLKGLVKQIFDIIPSYYDEDEASEIAALITEYVKWVAEQNGTAKTYIDDSTKNEMRYL